MPQCASLEVQDAHNGDSWECVHIYVCVCVCVHAHRFGHTDWVCTERQCLLLLKVIADILLPLSKVSQAR